MTSKLATSRTVGMATAALLALGLLGGLLLAAQPAYAATPPEPTYASATVDGDYSEWDLTNDHFAHMYRAGDPLKPIESHLYLRYDCRTNTLYALVLAEEGVEVLEQPDDAFVKLGNTTKLVDGNDSPPDGTPPDFEWITDNGTTGWEASASLAPRIYSNLNVHVQVLANDESQTSAVADRAILLDIRCETGGTPDIRVEKTPLDDNITPPVTIQYEYQVYNPGDVPLSNVTVADNTCSPLVFQGGDDSPANGALDPGETWLYTCSYYFAGPSSPGTCIVNEVTAQGDYDGQTVKDEHPGVVHCAAPPQGGIQVLKTADLEHACPNQKVLYRYEVSSLGDNALSNVAVQDDTCGPLIGPDGDDNFDGRLDPGETWVYMCRYRVTGREANPLENRVIASGDALEDGQVVASFTDRHPGIVQIVPCREVEFVPEPGTLLLTATGLAGLAGYASLTIRRRRHH
jgi:hypothetical protein